VFIPLWGLILIATAFVWLLLALGHKKDSDQREQMERLEKSAMFPEDGEDL
jgi:hypothetical protein